MLSANVVISGDAQLMAKLSHFNSQIEDFSGALNKIGIRLVSYYRDDVFNSQGGVFGRKWQTLAPSTSKYKTKHFRQYAAVPLMATGTMRKSFYKDSTRNSLTIGNDAPYFVYHQSTEERHKIPRRQMLGVNNSVKNIIQSTIKQDIMDKLASI